MKPGAVLLASALLLGVSAVPADAGGRRLTMDDPGGGMDVNLVVREVSVTPARARAGDRVRIELLVESVAEGAGSARARVTANGREVASALHNYGWGGEGGRLVRQTLVWDTTGVKPGEYRIRGEVSVWEDSSPSDNELTLPRPLVVLPAGSTETTGGTISVRDPRYRPAG